jgi:hypothetical protein
MFLLYNGSMDCLLMIITLYLLSKKVDVLFVYGGPVKEDLPLTIVTELEECVVFSV